jgi:hypothetical protein
MSDGNVFSSPVRKIKADRMSNSLTVTPYKKGGGGVDNHSKNFSNQDHL